MIEKVARPVDLVESVKNALFDAILTGSLRPGEKLRQEKLAEKLGVSRQPVSHALRILLDQGILTELGSKSLTVTELDPKKMQQIFEVRTELESYAAMLAAQRSMRCQFSSADITTLEALQKLVKIDRQDGGFDVKQSVRDDIQFHLLIRNLSGNPYIHETLSPHLLHHNRLMYLIQGHNDHASWKEHAEILKCIVDGEKEKAGILVRTHIAGGVAVLQQYWENLANSSGSAGVGTV